MKDILLFISDQHAWQQQHYAGDNVLRTPNLDRIAATGSVFTNCYTSFPVCVPARMSMLVSQYPSSCGVTHNWASLDSNQATFVHCLRSIGYDTTLCGRMHFVGGDQRHGFSNRIMGEFTPIYHNRPASILAGERGVHANTAVGGAPSLEITGGGNSPTLEYDIAVTNAAVDYLSHNYDKPQFLCVGSYGPHHPYVAPEDLYSYYYDKVTLPEDTFSLQEHPAVDGSIIKNTELNVVRSVRAAYYGMVEQLDRHIGQVYDAFQDYLKRTGHEGVFIYVSDHGELCGYRGYYGKAVFYESSAHIPMLFSGAGIKEHAVQRGSASLLDLGPTICQLAGAPPIPHAQGQSLFPRLHTGDDDPERFVLCETSDGRDYTGQQSFVYGRMVKWKQYKLVHYCGYDDDDQLFDLEADPDEKENIIHQNPRLVEQMRKFFDNFTVSPEKIKSQLVDRSESLKILMSCDLDSPERWRSPARAGLPPIIK